MFYIKEVLITSVKSTGFSVDIIIINNTNVRVSVFSRFTEFGYLVITSSISWIRISDNNLLKFIVRLRNVCFSRDVISFL